MKGEHIQHLRYGCARGSNASYARAGTTGAKLYKSVSVATRPAPSPFSCSRWLGTVQTLLAVAKHQVARWRDSKWWLPSTCSRGDHLPHPADLHRDVGRATAYIDVCVGSNVPLSWSWRSAEKKNLKGHSPVKSGHQVSCTKAAEEQIGLAGKEMLRDQKEAAHAEEQAAATKEAAASRKCWSCPGRRASCAGRRGSYPSRKKTAPAEEAVDPLRRQEEHFRRR